MLRRILMVSLFLNLAVLGTGAYMVLQRGGWPYLRARLSGAPVDPFPGVYWQHRESQFASLPVPERRPVLFVGDSLTEGGEWQELLGAATGGAPVLNRGIGNDTAEGVRRRVGSIVRLQPRAVFLMIGINDVGRVDAGGSPELADWLGTVRAIVDGIREGSPDTVIYLQSILPVADGLRARMTDPVIAAMVGSRRNRTIQEMNREIQTLTDGGAVVYVDLFDAFLSGDGAGLNPEFSGDGLHLNGAGYRLWSGRLTPLVALAAGVGQETESAR